MNISYTYYYNKVGRLGYSRILLIFHYPFQTVILFLSWYLYYKIISNISRYLPI